MRFSFRRLPLVVLLPAVLLAGCGGSKGPTTPTPPTATTCAFTISSMNVTVGPTGGPTTLTVTTGNTCVWTTVPNNSFITITSAVGQTGTGTVTFTVAENTGAARVGSLTIGGQAVTVNQGAAATPLTWLPPLPPAGVVGQPYNWNFANAAGGIDPVRYQLDTGTGFLPFGLTLNSSGSVTGIPTQVFNGAFSICVVDGASRSVCRPFGLVINAAPTTDDPLLGNWTGTITLNVGCVTGLPRTYTWTAIIRKGGATGTELAITVPGVGVVAEVYPLTLVGSSITFSVPFDSTYNFAGTVSSDRRGIGSGTFVGGNCNISSNVVLPSGTWIGTHQ